MIHFLDTEVLVNYINCMLFIKLMPIINIFEARNFTFYLNYLCQFYVFTFFMMTEVEMFLNEKDSGDIPFNLIAMTYMCTYLITYLLSCKNLKNLKGWHCSFSLWKYLKHYVFLCLGLSFTVLQTNSCCL